MNNKFLKNLIFTSITASSDEPFTIYRTGTQSSITITLEKTGSPVVSGLYYRYGNSGDWLPLADSSGNLSTLTLNSTNGYEVQLYNTNYTFSTDISNRLSFSFAGGYAGCKGNIQSLTNFSNVCKSYCYYRMFIKDMLDKCFWLTEVNNLSLPATTLERFCYTNMFENCASLIEAPSILPANTLAVGCYSEMFSNCSKLTKAPKLPATTLASRCYEEMFYGCSSLTQAPKLPATTLADNCYYYMFYRCNSLIEAPPILPATTLASRCYNYMFYGCTSLVNAPELPATTLASRCYNYMFYGCTSLVNAPELPATALADYCYQYMFNGCTSLNYIKVGFTSWHSNATNYWVENVSSTGTFEAPSSLFVKFGKHGIPEGWSLPGHKNIIIANDQQCSSMPNQEFSYTIQYSLYPETLEPTFKITSGTLPDGVTFNGNTGVVSGLVPSEITTNLQITLSCDGCEDKVINFTIFIETAKWTENNLTSNTSNSAYQVSQRSTVATAQAWKAMDGDVISNSITRPASDQYDWWMIDFTSPVLLKAVELNCNNEDSYGTYLEGSDDNSTWTRLDETKFPGNATTLREYSLTTAYRYYRLISETQFSHIRFYEVKFKYDTSN